MAERKMHRFKIPKRMILTALALLLVMAFVIFSTVYITNNVYWAYMLFEFFSIICAIIVVSKKGAPSYKMAWIALILAIPFAGWLLYLIFGGNRVLPYLKKRHAKITEESAPFRATDAEIMKAIKENGQQGAKQANYLSKESGYPPYFAEKTEYFPSGEAVFADILKRLERAEKYIFIEFFILVQGYMWDEIHKILKRKAEKGLDVRIIFDDFGSANRQQIRFAEDLRQEGINVAVFNPIKPSSNMFLNNRLHRKMIVIDGEIAFTGGFNIADEYINRASRFGHWLDCGIRIEGKPVDSFVVMFINMWNFTSLKTRLEIPGYLVSHEDKKEKGFLLPYCDGPLDDNLPAKGIYLQMINSARSYLYIASPYLILDSTLSEALTRCAKSGVDVRIITPKKWDKWYVHPVTQSYYQELLDAGVKIFEYTPGFIHSKLFIADDRFATVGTVNMDYRSFYFHFEMGVWLCETETVMDVKKNILNTLAVSEEINSKEWKKRPLKLKIKQMILRLFAPFM